MREVLTIESVEKPVSGLLMPLLALLVCPGTAETQGRQPVL